MISITLKLKSDFHIITIENVGSYEIQYRFLKIYSNSQILYYAIDDIINFVIETAGDVDEVL